MGHPARLIGYDVEGFSKLVLRHVLTHGHRAGELAAGALVEGERAVSALLDQHGFRFADTIGDGSIYWQPGEVADQNQPPPSELLELQVRRTFMEACGLPIRVATASGPADAFVLPGEQTRLPPLVWGEGVARLHDALQNTQRLGASGTRGAERPPLPQDVLGKIGREITVYIRLLRAEHWHRFDPMAAVAIVETIERWSRSINGVLEKLSHDDKGVHLRLSFEPGDLAADDLRDGLSSIVTAVIAEGYEGAATAAQGYIYRGVLPGVAALVHGDAINRAAKALPGTGDGEVNWLIEAEHRDVPPVAGSVTSHPIGRETELATLREWLDSGPTAFAAVFAQAGAGKTHLARYVFDERKPDAAHAAWLRCTAQTPVTAFGAISALFQPLLAQAAERGSMDDPASFLDQFMGESDIPLEWRNACGRLAWPDFPGKHEEAGDQSERQVILSGFARSLVARLAADGTILVGIDDAHLLDLESAAIFTECLASGVQLHGIAAARPAESQALLSVVTNQPAILFLSLEAMAVPDLKALLRQHRPDLDPRQQNEIALLANGNPFFAIQAGMAMAAGGAEEGLDIRQLIDRRLNRLDAERACLLRLAAIFDQPLSAAELAELASAIEVPLEPAGLVDQLVERALLRPSLADPERLEIAHDLIAQTVRATLPSGVERKMGHACARRFQNEIAKGSAPRDALPRLAAYWTHAGSDARATMVLARAARLSAAEGLYRQAGDLFERAIERLGTFASTSHPRLAVLKTQLADVLWSQGELERANRLAGECLKPPGRTSQRSREASARAAAIAGETSYFSGDWRQMMAANWAILRSPEERRDVAIAQGRSFASVGYTLGLARLTPLVRMVMKRAERIGAAYGDTRPAAYALSSQAFIHVAFCRWAEARKALEAARVAMQEWPYEYHWQEILETNWGLESLFRGDFSNAERHFSSLRDRAAQRSHRLHLGWAQYSLAAVAIGQQRFEHAFEPLAEATGLIEDSGDRQSLHICCGLNARMNWGLGRTEEAVNWARRGAELSRQLLPLNYSSLEAFGGGPLVLALAEHHGLIEPRETSGSMGPLMRFAALLPFARTRYRMVRAVRMARSRPASARHHFAKAAHQADERGLVGEAALARSLAAACNIQIEHPLGGDPSWSIIPARPMT